MAKKSEPIVSEEPIIENPTPEATPEPQGAEVTPPKKRGRGRPTNAERAANAASGLGAASVREDGKSSRPGRRSKKTEFNSEQRGILARQIQGIHQIAAMATSIPELQIDDNAALLLAEAVANVAQEYDLSISGKTGALIQLVAACAMVYAPRFAVINQRVKENKAKREQDSMRVVGGTDAATTAAH